jgi:hypothetical protein
MKRKASRNSPVCVVASIAARRPGPASSRFSVFRAGRFSSLVDPCRSVRKLQTVGMRCQLCPICSSLVHGGEVRKDDQFTIYAGTLDDPSTFHPTMAIFTRDRPAWVVLPAGLKTFEEMPPG